MRIEFVVPHVRGERISEIFHMLRQWKLVKELLVVRVCFIQQSLSKKLYPFIQEPLRHIANIGLIINRDGELLVCTLLLYPLIAIKVGGNKH